ncbi:MAG: hypothetical protein JW918_04780 [Anaerolineae bacterium]|nr:hypothetical protein [Anaerolineae bacterium]
MAKRPQQWVIGGFILLAILVIAFVLVNLLLSQGIGLPATFLILPGEVTLHPGEGCQFRAVAGDRLMPGVKWTASDGDIGPEGFYVAPDAPGDYQIIAQHPNSEYRTAVTVHVVAADENSTEQPPNPTETAIPTIASTVTSAAPAHSPSPAPTQTSASVSTVFFDAAGDLVSFDTLGPVAFAPPGTDIRAACFASERQLMRTVPEELAGKVSDWDTKENLVLWLTFHEPVPTVPDMERYWIFALDVDGNTATGRPIDEGKINPDIGVEVTIGVHSNPTAGIELSPYIMIWNTRLATSELVAMDLDARLSTTRDALFVRIPEKQLAETIRAVSGVEPNWNQAAGRALATATTSEGTVADFAPERP